MSILHFQKWLVEQQQEEVAELLQKLRNYPGVVDVKQVVNPEIGTTYYGVSDSGKFPAAVSIDDQGDAVWSDDPLEIKSWLRYDKQLMGS